MLNLDLFVLLLLALSLESLSYLLVLHCLLPTIFVVCFFLFKLLLSSTCCYSLVV